MLNGASSFTILAEDEENAEVQNLLEPETNGGQPGGDAAMKPEAAPKAGEEVKAKPDGDDWLISAAIAFRSLLSTTPSPVTSPSKR